MTSKHSQAPILISQGIFDSVKTFRDLEQRISALIDTNTKAQGDAFEIFVEAYLINQPKMPIKNNTSDTPTMAYT
jgi:hypothetical protein